MGAAFSKKRKTADHTIKGVKKQLTEEDADKYNLIIEKATEKHGFD